jgi:hypothetical protein
MIPFLYVLLDSTQYSSDRLPALDAHAGEQPRETAVFVFWPAWITQARRCP